MAKTDIDISASHLPSPVIPSLRMGIDCLRRGEQLAAMAHFEALLRRARQHPNHADEAVALSYYGLALAMHSPQRREAVGLCERAAQVEFFNPDLYLNLARVYMVHGERNRAYEAVRRGLTLRPAHTGLREALRDIGKRRLPVVWFLPRRHALNVLLGRWRNRLFPC